MIVLQVNGLTKSFSGTDILENVQLEVQHRDRVALVGRNGAGKSTLLKIIAGEMTADSGDLIVPKDIRIGYLEQHSGIDSALTVWDEMMTVFEPLHSMERRLRSLEGQMADPAVYDNPMTMNVSSKNTMHYKSNSKIPVAINMNRIHARCFTGCDFIQRITTKSVNLLIRWSKNEIGTC